MQSLCLENHRPGFSHTGLCEEPAISDQLLQGNILEELKVNCKAAAELFVKTALPLGV